MLNSLKNLYVKLGGALTDTYAGIAGGKPVSDYFLTTDVIAACTEKAGGGGGGAEDFVVNATLTAGSGTPTITSETTIADILDAYDDGKNIKLKLVGEGMPDMFGSLAYIVDGDDAAAGFMCYMSNVALIECNTNGWSIS